MCIQLREGFVLCHCLLRLTFGVAKEFDGFLKAMPNVKMVLLDSVGGRVYEAGRALAI